MIVYEMTLTSPLGDSLLLGGDPSFDAGSHLVGFTIDDGVVLNPADISVHVANLPLASGGVLVGGRYKPRRFEASGRVMAETPAEVSALRASLIRVLSDHEEPVEMTVTDIDGTSRTLDVYVTDGPEFDTDGPWVSYRFEVTAGDPVAYAATQSTGVAGLASPGAVMTNSGDAAVATTCTVTFVGADTGFTLTNSTTGESFTAEGLTADASTSVEVEGQPGQESLSVDGVSSFSKMAAGARFLRLIPGDNRVFVTSPSGNARAEVVWTSGWVS